MTLRVAERFVPKLREVLIGEAKASGEHVLIPLKRPINGRLDSPDWMMDTLVLEKARITSARGNPLWVFSGLTTRSILTPEARRRNPFLVIVQPHEKAEPTIRRVLGKVLGDSFLNTRPSEEETRRHINGLIPKMRDWFFDGIEMPGGARLKHLPGRTINAFILTRPTLTNPRGQRISRGTRVEGVYRVPFRKSGVNYIAEPIRLTIHQREEIEDSLGRPLVWKLRNRPISFRILGVEKK